MPAISEDTINEDYYRAPEGFTGRCRVCDERIKPGQKVFEEIFSITTKRGEHREVTEHEHDGGCAA